MSFWYFPGPLSLAIPLWVDAMSTGDGFSHLWQRWGRNGEFCVVVCPATRTACILAYALFPALRSHLSVSVTVSVKSVSVLPFRKRRCRSRHICEWPGRPSGWRASFPRIRVGGASGLLLRQRKNRTRFYMNGITAMANLRKRKTLFFT